MRPETSANHNHDTKQNDLQADQVEDSAVVSSRLAKEVAAINERHEKWDNRDKQVDDYKFIKQEQKDWDKVLNDGYQAVMNEIKRGPDNGLGHQLDPWAKSLINEEKAWISLRDASFATIDTQFGIDPNKKGQTESEIVKKTHDLIPPLEKEEIVKQRALHFVELYNEITGPGE